MWVPDRVMALRRRFLPRRKHPKFRSNSGKNSFPSTRTHHDTSSWRFRTWMPSCETLRVRSPNHRACRHEGRHTASRGVVQGRKWHFQDSIRYARQWLDTTCPLCSSLHIISKGDPITIHIKTINLSPELWGSDTHDLKYVAFRRRVVCCAHPLDARRERRYGATSCILPRRPPSMHRLPDLPTHASLTCCTKFVGMSAQDHFDILLIALQSLIIEPLQVVQANIALEVQTLVQVTNTSNSSMYTIHSGTKDTK